MSLRSRPALLLRTRLGSVRPTLLCARRATTMTAFRLAQARQLILRKILFSRFDALVRGAGVSDALAQLLSGQRLEEFKLAQAESAAR